MNINDIPDNPYILLTPGPLSTTKTVKAAMLRDWCTWDNDYNSVIQKLRSDLVSLATQQTDDYTAILMQGSGTFTVESVIGSVIPRTGKLLVLTNGAYGNRIVEIAKILGIDHIQQDSGEMHPIDIEKLKENMAANPAITHVAVIHCETTTGMLNNIETVGQIVKEHNKIFIVDAMSSFGGIPIDAAKLQIDFLISSSNKCIQGTPGFGFIIAKKTELAKCNGNARSLSLDIYDQWNTMEKGSGKWRYTSPTHVVMAFVQAMKELAEEGGITARHRRYSNNQKVLVNGMKTLGFEPLLAENLHSPIITSFLYPANAKFNFSYFYDELKKFGFVIYPGKISKTDTFRIGNIGDVYQKDIELLLEKIEKYVLSAKIK